MASTRTTIEIEGIEIEGIEIEGIYGTEVLGSLSIIRAQKKGSDDMKAFCSLALRSF